MIRVKNLTKRYPNGFCAVKDVSFEIQKGEIVGLLGPNGAGKTTIMKMITCFMNPSEGSIEVNGMNTIDEPNSIKSLIGYLPEHTPQYGDMTVYEYLDFTAQIRSIPVKGKISAIAKMIKLTSLENVVTKKINQLSNGYRKRVGLASVMIHDPKILILDEPTSGLDPNQIITFRKILRRLSEQKTIILSTHILSEIEAICEKVIIIKNGKIAANDTIRNLIDANKDDQFVNFVIEGDNLLEVEKAITNIAGAWKVEFEKKDDRNEFRFKALINKDSDFEKNLNETVENKGWKVLSAQREDANLEEIFLRLTGEEEDRA